VFLSLLKSSKDAPQSLRMHHNDGLAATNLIIFNCALRVARGGLAFVKNDWCILKGLGQEIDF
jgi:hypothetical protein